MAQEHWRLDDTVAAEAKQPRGKGKSKSSTPSTGRAPSKTATGKVHAARSAVRWAKAYTGTAVGMSAGLNAYASWEACPGDGMLPWVAAGVGATIPALVWLLGSVTAYTFRAGWRRLAGAVAGIACCVLALSVIHVASALANLTGSNLLLAGLLAVGIDCGLVASEAVSVLLADE